MRSEEQVVPRLTSVSRKSIGAKKKKKKKKARGGLPVLVRNLLNIPVAFRLSAEHLRPEEDSKGRSVSFICL